MFTRQHYTAIANLLGQVKPEYYETSCVEYTQWKDTVEAFVKLFTQDNENFKADKFRLVASNMQPYWNCQVGD